jgi:DNA polymerase (family 10)
MTMDAGQPEPTSRLAIVAALHEIAARLRLAGDNRFRARAYDEAADAVEALSDDALREFLATDTLTSIDRIGPAVARVVVEMATRGRSELLERMRADSPAALLELSQIPGISRSRAHKLIQGLGVANLDELEAAGRAQRIRRVKGFGAKTEAAVLTAIERYRRRPQALRLIDAQDAAAALARFVASLPGIRTAEVVGGIRRWEEVVDEIAVVGLVDAAQGAPSLDSVAAYPPLSRIEERSQDHVVGRLANGVRVRIRVAPIARRGFAMIEETGPAEHLGRVREWATQHGMVWDSLKGRDEAEVYGALSLPLIPPETRAWISLPPPPDLNDLVSASDLQGLVHCHTTFSDGRHTLAEMAQAADALGMRYMTVTDHSPTAAYAGGLTIDRLREQWDEIDRVQETVSVRLLRGTESDILADGALDYPDAVLEKLDVIVASIHNRYRMDAAAMTERLVRAMRLPMFKIWGHALGRLILRREPIACDVEAVLDAVAASRAAIEISGDPYRLDLPPAWIPAARRRGIRFVISTDAHAVCDLENVAFGVAMARRGGVRRGEVLNAQPLADFQAAVRP